MSNFRLREARGDISVEQVCLDCGISVSAYRKYESGIRVPRDEKKIVLANYFGKSVQELFFYK